MNLKYFWEYIDINSFTFQIGVKRTIITDSLFMQHFFRNPV